MDVALKKPNQDSFVCAPKFMGNKNQALFGVFDGHGSYGDVCAKFAADKVDLSVYIVGVFLKNK